MRVQWTNWPLIRAGRFNLSNNLSQLSDCSSRSCLSRPEVLFIDFRGKRTNLGLHHLSLWFDSLVFLSSPTWTKLRTQSSLCSKRVFRSSIGFKNESIEVFLEHRWLLCSIWVVDDQLAFFSTGKSPVANHEFPLSWRTWKKRLTCCSCLHLTLCSKQFLKEFSSIFCWVSCSFRRPWRIHCCQFSIQNKAEPTIWSVRQFNGCHVWPEV